MDEPRKHYAGGQRPDAKGHMMILFVCNMQKGRSTETEKWCPVLQCELFFKGEHAQDEMAMVRREHGGWPFWNLTGERTEKQPTQASPAPHPFICFGCYCIVSVIARKCSEIENFFFFKIVKGFPHTSSLIHLPPHIFLGENIEVLVP